jgi:hypothetical protein
MRQRKRRRLEEEGGARAHRGGRNRASMAAGTADSIEKNRAARWRFGAIERGVLKRASRGFYRCSGLTRGLGFRENQTDVREAVFGSVSCSR